MNATERPQGMSAAPVLNALRLAWLEELGLDRRLLSRYEVHAGQASASAAAPVATAAASQETIQPAGAASAPPSPAQVEPKAAAPASAASSSAGLAAVRGLLRSLKGLKPEDAVVPAPEPVEAAKAAPEDLPEPGTLEALRYEVMHCQACALHQDRGIGVFGDGNSQAPAWLVIGEAPGTLDDRAGLPFQGRAGELLHAMLKAAGADVSSEVFFTNAVKCRPIANRPPVDAEVAQCGLHLRAQIALLQPQRILALGRVAAALLTGQEGDLEALRGKVWQYACASGRQIPVVATYHPGWLMSHPYHKAGAWDDLRLARGIVQV